MDPVQSEYIPGVCNIGRAERTARLIVGWAGLAISLGLAIALLLAGAKPAWRLFVFLPTFLAAIGFLQAASHFCARFGFSGVFNFGPNVGKTDTVQQAEFRRLDRAKAFKIVGISFLIAAAVAAVVYSVPL